MACLVLKEFARLDYRGLAAHLDDHPDLRALIGLKAVPHYTTFQKAAQRLLAELRADVGELTHLLSEAGFTVDSLSGEMEQRERNKALAAFIRDKRFLALRRVLSSALAKSSGVSTPEGM